MFLWPVPDTPYGCQLELWQQLQSGVLPQTPMSLAPGYWDALVYSLAVSLLPSGEKPPNPALVELGRRALTFITGANSAVPTFGTQDIGMPTSVAGAGKRQDFNYTTGKIV